MTSNLSQYLSAYICVYLRFVFSLHSRAFVSIRGFWFWPLPCSYVVNKRPAEKPVLRDVDVAKGRRLKIEFVHIVFGAIGPATAVNHFSSEADLIVAGYTEVHAIGNLLAVQHHDSDFVHEVAGIR